MIYDLTATFEINQFMFLRERVWIESLGPKNQTWYDIQDRGGVLNWPILLAFHLFCAAVMRNTMNEIERSFWWDVWEAKACDTQKVD